jgi:transposase
MHSATFIPRDYEIFAGLDVDKRSSAVTFTDHAQVLRSISMPNKADHWVNYVRNHFPNKKVAFAYEAGPTGYGLYDGLAAQAYRCVIASPAMMPPAPGQRVKTNRLDSRKLAESLRGGQLKPIHVPAGPYRELRHLPQLREALVSELVGMKQRIKSLLVVEGLEFPAAPAGSQWSGRVKQHLRQLPCAPPVRCNLAQLLDRVEFTEKQVVATTRELRRFCRTDPALARCLTYLMSIRGIGGIVGTQLLARIGDWRELTKVRQLAGFLGVVPTEHATGERTVRGAITHSGDPRLRSHLIQAAWSAIRQDGELREFYRAVCHTHPRHVAARVAIVAVARKLSARIAVVLMQQRPYEIRKKVRSAPLTPEETAPQGTTRRQAEPGERHS